LRVRCDAAEGNPCSTSRLSALDPELVGDGFPSCGKLADDGHDHGRGHALRWEFARDVADRRYCSSMAASSSSRARRRPCSTSRSTTNQDF